MPLLLFLTKLASVDARQGIAEFYLDGRESLCWGCPVTRTLAWAYLDWKVPLPISQLLLFGWRRLHFTLRSEGIRLKRSYLVLGRCIQYFSIYLAYRLLQETISSRLSYVSFCARDSHKLDVDVVFLGYMTRSSLQLGQLRRIGISVNVIPSNRALRSPTPGGGVL